MSAQPGVTELQEMFRNVSTTILRSYIEEFYDEKEQQHIKHQLEKIAEEKKNNELPKVTPRTTTTKIFKPKELHL